MTKSKEPATTPSMPGTAPELPRAIAKQYGLHHERTITTTSSEPNQENTSNLPDDDTVNATVLPLDQLEANTGIESMETEAAVDDLIAHESDQLLDAAASSTPPTVKRKSFFRRFFGGWWRNRFLRYATLLLILVAILVIFLVPQYRYNILNAVGVRSSTSVIVVDDVTGLPLKNVNVSVAGRETKTNIAGVAKIQGLKLGNYKLVVERLAFASYERPVIIGWGSNPLGTIELEAIGTKYALSIVDYMTGAPIVGAEAESSESNAIADDKGNISLTVADSSITKLSIKISAAGYRPQVVEVEANLKEPKRIVLTPSQKVLYMHKAGNTYDLYSSDIDGQDKKIILAGTGHESSSIGLVVNSTGSLAALVSTRDNKKDPSGNRLQSLTLVHVDSGKTMTIETAERIQLIDWLGDRLVYRTTISGAAFNDPQRNRLISYDLANNTRSQLATANKITAALSADNYIYYAIDNAGLNDQSGNGFYRVKAEAINREKLLNETIWSALRTSPEVIALQQPVGWQHFDIDSKQLTPGAAPAPPTGYYFANNPQGNQTAWVAKTNGQMSLLFRDETGTEKVLITRTDITYPIRWLTNSLLVYRIAAPGEIADYVVSTKGGSPKKIADVAASYGYVQTN